MCLQSRTHTDCPIRTCDGTAVLYVNLVASPAGRLGPSALQIEVVPQVAVDKLVQPIPPVLDVLRIELTFEAE